MYNQNKTLYNINIKPIIKISIFATFQQHFWLNTIFLSSSHIIKIQVG